MYRRSRCSTALVRAASRQRWKPPGFGCACRPRAPMPVHSGRTTAPPVLFKIADLLGPAPALSEPEAPPNALRVGRRDLPTHLRRLDAGPLDGGRAADPGAPKILYPPDGATVAWDGAAVPLEASGGHGPLRWLVDGRPLAPAAPRRALPWRQGGRGFGRRAASPRTG